MSEGDLATAARIAEQDAIIKELVAVLCAIGDEVESGNDCDANLIWRGSGKALVARAIKDSG